MTLILKMGEQKHFTRAMGKQLNGSCDIEIQDVNFVDFNKRFEKFQVLIEGKFSDFLKLGLSRSFQTRCVPWKFCYSNREPAIKTVNLYKSQCLCLGCHLLNINLFRLLAGDCGRSNE